MILLLIKSKQRLLTVRTAPSVRPSVAPHPTRCLSYALHLQCAHQLHPSDPMPFLPSLHCNPCHLLIRGGRAMGRTLVTFFGIKKNIVVQACRTSLPSTPTTLLRGVSTLLQHWKSFDSQVSHVLPPFFSSHPSSFPALSHSGWDHAFKQTAASKSPAHQLFCTSILPFARIHSLHYFHPLVLLFFFFFHILSTKKNSSPAILSGSIPLLLCFYLQPSRLATPLVGTFLGPPPPCTYPEFLLHFAATAISTTHRYPPG